MQTLHYSATEARNNFFSILNEVSKGKEAVITKNDKTSFSLTSKPYKKKKNMKALLKKMVTNGVHFSQPWEELEQVIETKFDQT